MKDRTSAFVGAMAAVRWGYSRYDRTDSVSSPPIPVADRVAEER